MHEHSHLWHHWKQNHRTGHISGKSHQGQRLKGLERVSWGPLCEHSRPDRVLACSDNIVCRGWHTVQVKSQGEKASHPARPRQSHPQILPRTPHPASPAALPGFPLLPWASWLTSDHCVTWEVLLLLEQGPGCVQRLRASAGTS